MKLSVEIFADGAQKDQMLRLYNDPSISGLTTNPTLMRAAGITNYKDFCLEVLETVKSKPISFEVFSDEMAGMERQAKEISSWGDNVFVKIPVTNSLGESTADLIHNLSNDGVQLNITALMTLEQVQEVVSALSVDTKSYISVFAGRIFDTGVDAVPIMTKALELMDARPLSKLIWASPREVFNIYQAADIGCHVITVTPDLIKKLALQGKDLTAYSLDTVKMFKEDAETAGYNL